MKRKKMFLAVVVLFGMSLSTVAVAQATNAQLAEANQKLAETLQQLEDCLSPPAKVAAVNAVNKKAKGPWNPKLSTKQRGQVDEMIREALEGIQTADCCEALWTAVKSMDVRILKLEDAVENLQQNALNGIAKDSVQDLRLDALEKKPSGGSSISSSGYSDKNSVVDFYLRGFIGFNLTGSQFRKVLNVGTAGASFVLSKHYAKINDTENVKVREGWVLVGLNGLIGMSLQTQTDPFYGGGGFLAGQWRSGVYLGVSVDTVVGGMTPSKYWMINPAALFGVTAPGPKSEKKVGFFAEILLGPTVMWGYPLDAPPERDIYPNLGIRLGLKAL